MDLHAFELERLVAAHLNHTLSDCDAEAENMLQRTTSKAKLKALQCRFYTLLEVHSSMLSEFIDDCSQTVLIVLKGYQFNDMYYFLLIVW